eukprot:409833_1
MDTTVISIIVAVVAVIIVGIVWYFKPSSGIISSKYNRILIYGPCGSGKTLLFFKLLHGRNQETQSSMQENRESFIPKQEEINKQYEFVDLSGHPSQSYRIKKYCEKIKYVIFMIDSTDLQNINNSSKMLYELLSLKTFYSIKPLPKILIIANKIDQPNITTINTIKTTLIKELNNLYQSHSSLSSVAEDKNEDDNQNVDIVKSNQENIFTWNDLKYDISFGSCDVLANKIQPILTFLDK